MITIESALVSPNANCLNYPSLNLLYVQRIHQIPVEGQASDGFLLYLCMAMGCAMGIIDLFQVVNLNSVCRLLRCPKAE